MESRFTVVDTNLIAYPFGKAYHIFDKKLNAKARIPHPLPDLGTAVRLCEALNGLDDLYGPDLVVRRVPKVVVRAIKPGEANDYAPGQLMWFVVENRITGERLGEFDLEPDATALRDQLLAKQNSH
ncbi:hypothetical protein AAZU54_01305 [Pseudomonas sp. Je.1.5.c]|uniref:hypothetical protein n=1 Tax=Pseudomonas sp. Je.1.5.c TaxID=3142839 RepID=UPI003DA7C2C6